MAQSKEKATRPPYIPFKTVDSFIQKLKVGVPNRIDNSLMGSLSGTVRSHLVATLRYLGLISDQNITSEVLKRLVLSDEGSPERERVWREILEEAYPFLLDGSFDLAGATVRQLDEQFQLRGATGETVRKCSAFFTQAAKCAGISLSPYIANVPRGSRASRPNGARAKRGGDTADQGAGEAADTKSAPARAARSTSRDVDGTDGSAKHSRSGPWEHLLLEKFPVFDPSWDKDVQLEWFRAFAELRKAHG